MSWYVDEAERMNRLLRGLYDDPTRKLMRDMERYRELMEPPGYRALRDFQDNFAAEALRTQEALTSAFSGVLGHNKVLQMLRLESAYSDTVALEAQKALHAFQSPPFPAIEMLLRSLKEASRSAVLLEDFERTFGGQLLDRAQAVAEASEDDLDVRIEELTTLLHTHIAESKRGPVSLEGYIQIILAVAFFIQSFISAQRSEENHMKSFRDIDATLKRLATVENVDIEPDLALVSAKSLRVRGAPNTRSSIEGTLTLNALVRVVGYEKSWVRVEYFDFIGGCTREGWVPKRYLRDVSHPRDPFVGEAARRVFERSEW